MGQTGFDEMKGRDGVCREPYQVLSDWLQTAPTSLLNRRREEAELLFRRVGITFAVYNEGGDPNG